MGIRRLDWGWVGCFQEDLPTGLLAGGFKIPYCVGVCLLWSLRVFMMEQLLFSRERRGRKRVRQTLA